MLKIAICDDEVMFQDDCKIKCENIANKMNILIDINIFDDGLVLLALLKKNAFSYDIIFMDIQMERCNGIDVAQEIRKLNQKVSIIFTTNHDKYSLNSYKARPFNYLLKPISQKDLEEDIQYIYNNKIKKLDYIYLKQRQVWKKILVSEIQYIESKNRHVFIYIANQEPLVFSRRLEAILQDINRNQILRCHNSFAINLDNILEVSSTKLITKSNEEIPVSRKYSHFIKQSFFHYLSTEGKDS